MLLGAVALSLSAKKIEMPFYEASSAEHLYVESVEMTDKITCFNLVMVHLPGYWCSIDTMSVHGSLTGKTYPLTKVENYVPGERKHMPENGVWRFKAYFPAMDERDSIVDLMTENRISGIRLMSTAPEGKIHTRIRGSYPGKSAVLMLEESVPTPIDPARRIWIPVDSCGRF